MGKFENIKGNLRFEWSRVILGLLRKPPPNRGEHGLWKRAPRVDRLNGYCVWNQNLTSAERTQTGIRANGNFTGKFRKTAIGIFWRHCVRTSLVTKHFDSFKMRLKNIRRGPLSPNSGVSQTMHFPFLQRGLTEKIIFLINRTARGQFR